MHVSQALCLSLSIWRFGLSFRQTSSWDFHHNKPHNGLDLRSVSSYLTAFSVGWTHSVRHGIVEGRFLERKQASKIKIKRQGHAPNVILKFSGKNTRSIERKLWKLTSRPLVSKTPANRSHQRRRLWREAGKCSERHASEHVTQSNGGVVQKSSIRNLPNTETKEPLEMQPLRCLFRTKRLSSWRSFKCLLESLPQFFRLFTFYYSL